MGGSNETGTVSLIVFGPQPSPPGVVRRRRHDRRHGAGRQRWNVHLERRLRPCRSGHLLVVRELRRRSERRPGELGVRRRDDRHRGHGTRPVSEHTLGRHHRDRDSRLGVGGGADRRLRPGRRNDHRLGVRPAELTTKLLRRAWRRRGHRERSNRVARTSRPARSPRGPRGLLVVRTLWRRREQSGGLVAVWCTDGRDDRLRSARADDSPRPAAATVSPTPTTSPTPPPTSGKPTAVTSALLRVHVRGFQVLLTVACRGTAHQRCSDRMILTVTERLSGGRVVGVIAGRATRPHNVSSRSGRSGSSSPAAGPGSSRSRSTALGASFVAIYRRLTARLELIQGPRATNARHGSPLRAPQSSGIAGDARPPFRSSSRPCRWNGHRPGVVGGVTDRSRLGDGASDVDSRKIDAGRFGSP